MHRALLISEVLSYIIDDLAGGIARYPETFRVRGIRRDGRRALTVLARTCRALSEPALDALWRRLHSLRPFLLCLPAKASYDGEMTKDTDDMLPTFNDEEWGILLRYTPRVQELTLENDELAIEILQSLWFRTALLLPNLRRLHWSYGDSTTIAPIRLLLSPSLVHCYMWLGDDDDHASSVLGLFEHYHTLCPDLKSLHVGNSSHASFITAAISRAICRSSRLEDLTCGPIDGTAWIHIAKSPRLKRLSAGLLDHRPESLMGLAYDPGFGDAPFENLRVLELHVEDLSSVIPYLKPRQQPFEEVSFSFCTLLTPEALHRFLVALGSTTRRGTLRRITLISFVPQKRTVYSPGLPIDFQILSLAMTFNLRAFVVNAGSVSLNDDELARLAQAWPDLETFQFNQHKWCRHHPTSHMPTLRGLLLLVARCPRLFNVGLSVNATNIPTLSEDESLICNTAIKRLSLANSPIQGSVVAGIAQFLLEHFPSLTVLSADNARNSYSSMWREANALIRELSGPWSESGSSDSETEIFP